MDKIRDAVRRGMYHVAGFIDHWTKGKIKPAHITTISLLGHVPVAWALIDCRPVLAGILLAFFALLDSLDGALARYQGSSSLSGMFYDSVSDRIKEVIVFSALAVYASKHIEADVTWQVVAAASTSILVSFVRARGEAALAGTSMKPKEVNSVFKGGIGSYELRTAMLVAGLIFGIIEYVLPLIIAANSITIASRFLAVSNKLHLEDQKNSSNSKSGAKKENVQD